MSLNTVEKKMLETLIQIRDYLTGGKVTKKEYYYLMDSIRHGIKLGENKKYGCIQGLHSDACTCTEEKQGNNAYYSRHKK